MRNRKVRPIKGWGVTYCNDPNVMPWTIREKRWQAIKTQSADGTTWETWKKAGCRCVRVTITQDPTP